MIAERLVLVRQGLSFNETFQEEETVCDTETLTVTRSQIGEGKTESQEEDCRRGGRKEWELYMKDLDKVINTYKVIEVKI